MAAALVLQPAATAAGGSACEGPGRASPAAPGPRTPGLVGASAVQKGWRPHEGNSEGSPHPWDPSLRPSWSPVRPPAHPPQALGGQSRVGALALPEARARVSAAGLAHVEAGSLGSGLGRAVRPSRWPSALGRTGNGQDSCPSFPHGGGGPHEPCYCPRSHGWFWGRRGPPHRTPPCVPCRVKMALAKKEEAVSSLRRQHEVSPAVAACGRGSPGLTTLVRVAGRDEAG